MTIKEDIVEVLCAIYKIPGQYFILALVCKAFWEATKYFPFFILTIFLIFMEVISPILAGVRLYENAIEWWKDTFS